VPVNVKQTATSPVSEKSQIIVPMSKDTSGISMGMTMDKREDPKQHPGCVDVSPVISSKTKVISPKSASANNKV